MTNINPGELAMSAYSYFGEIEVIHAGEIPAVERVTVYHCNECYALVTDGQIHVESVHPERPWKS
jgi:hypothetical protein